MLVLQYTYSLFTITYYFPKVLNADLVKSEQGRGKKLKVLNDSAFRPFRGEWWMRYATGISHLDGFESHYPFSHQTKKPRPYGLGFGLAVLNLMYIFDLLFKRLKTRNTQSCNGLLYFRTEKLCYFCVCTKYISRILSLEISAVITDIPHITILVAHYLILLPSD